MVAVIVCVRLMEDSRVVLQVEQLKPFSGLAFDFLGNIIPVTDDH